MVPFLIAPKLIASNEPEAVLPPKSTGCSRYLEASQREFKMWKSEEATHIARICPVTSSLVYGSTRFVQLAGIFSSLPNVQEPSDCWCAPKNEEMVARSGA